MNPIRSQRRVADHGEIITPAWMLEGMLDLVNSGIDSHPELSRHRLYGTVVERPLP